MRLLLSAVSNLKRLENFAYSSRTNYFATLVICHLHFFPL